MRWFVLCAVAVGCECRPPFVPVPDGGGDVGGGASSGGGNAAGGGNATGGGGGTTDGGLPFCDAYLRAACARLVRCNELDVAQLDDCLALLGWTCAQSEVDALIDGGRISFAASQSQACVAAVGAFPCGPNLNPSEC